jgi:predicted alpha/beta superfamily hydrolase
MGSVRACGVLVGVAMGAIGGLAGLAGGEALAQPGVAARQSVTFELNQTTTFGQSVYVLGTLSELGGVDPSLTSPDLSKAVKLAPNGYPVWRATLSLPRGVTYSYRYYLRNDGAGQSSQASNGTALGSVLSGSVPAGVPAAPGAKTVMWTTSWTQPTLWWRLASQGSGTPAAFQPVAMTRYGDAPGRAGETRWVAWGVGAGDVGRGVEFYFTGVGQSGATLRSPSTGQHATKMDDVFVQDGQLYSYVPSASMGASRRAYNPASPPSVFSSALGQTRFHRVYLPRGYDQHTDRRYPVLYMHDGQNVFEAGAFGSWNAAGTLEDLQRRGQMREVIVVGLDNVGSTRIQDYAAPDDFGRANLYAQYIVGQIKPLIDGGYRTRPEASLTGTAGSSMGGVVSQYLGWDYTSTFTRIGNFSPAWQVVSSFTNRVQSQTPRALRTYLDSGDSGTASDNYGLTLGVRDNWISGTSAKYALEGTLRHVIGFGQQHNEAAWSQRLPGALVFLYPAEEEPNDIVRLVCGSHWDLNSDGRIDLDDLLRLGEVGADLNLDGVSDVGGADARALEGFVRRNEAQTMGVRR